MLEQSKEDSSQKLLSTFMKNKIGEKTHKQEQSHKPHIPSSSNMAESTQENSEEVKSIALEALENQKFDNQTEMIKKMIVEKIAKYTLAIALIVSFAFGIIKFGPAITKFFNGFLYKILMGAIHR